MEINTLIHNLAGPIGCKYSPEHDKLIFVEYSGKISIIKDVNTAPKYQILGSGYTHLEDIVISQNRNIAFVTERGGYMLRIELNRANRQYAEVIASDLTAPQQMALFEEKGCIYTVEFADPGRLLNIDLATGIQRTIVDTLEWAIGLIITQDMKFAYISEQTNFNDGQISRINIQSGEREVIISGMADPFFLTWSDQNENAIIVPERDPANRVASINLAQSPRSNISYIAMGVPRRPSAVAVVEQSKLLLCCNDEICELSSIS